MTQTHDRVKQANEALREAAARLVEERRDLPPGSVLRCFSRAVRDALRAGFAPSEVAAEAERATRELLDLRVAPGRGRRAPRPAGLAVTRVPWPRGGT